MLKRIIGIGLFSLVTLWTWAQSVSYEYWLGDNYQGHIADSGGSGELSFSIDMSSLQQGMHFLNIRARQDNGSWGSVGRFVFLVPSVTPTAKSYEIWLDGQYDQRVRKQHSDTDFSEMVDISSLSSGLHYYNVRIEDSEDKWGPISRFFFFVPEKEIAQELKALEYWIDSETSNSTMIRINESDVELVIDISALSVGTHQFCCRLQKGNGTWSQDYVYDFNVEELSGIDSPFTDEGNKLLRIYLPTGVLLRSGRQNEVVKDLPKGLYIINGKKVIKD